MTPFNKKRSELKFASRIIPPQVVVVRPKLYKGNITAQVAYEKAMDKKIF